MVKQIALRLDEELYEQLAYRSRITGSTVTSVIRNLVEDFVSESLSATTKQKIETQVKDAIATCTNDIFISEISKLVAERLDIKDKNISEISEISEISNIDVDKLIAEDIDSHEALGNPKYSDEVVEAIAESGYYSDREVAEEQNISIKTVNHYRLGKRKPKPEFSKHWQVSEKYPKRWEYKKKAIASTSRSHDL